MKHFSKYGNNIKISTYDMDRWTTSQSRATISKSPASSLSKRCSKTPSLQTVFPSGVASEHQPTCLPKSICLESTTTEGAPVAEGEPDGNGDSRKKKRQKHAQHCQQLTRAQFPGGRFPAKFGCQPIKLEWYPSRTCIPRITCACTSGISEYIKRVE